MSPPSYNSTKHNPRDPYPYPKYQGDVQFRGESPKQCKTHGSTTEEAQAKVNIFKRILRFFLLKMRL